jgi:hypothetical protein
MCATTSEVLGVFCANPVQSRIIADRITPPASIAPSLGVHYSPNWCNKTDFFVHYFGANNLHAPNW